MVGKIKGCKLCQGRPRGKRRSHRMGWESELEIFSGQGNSVCKAMGRRPFKAH